MKNKSTDRIILLDTSIGTENAGDLIIMDAVRKQLRSIFSRDFFVSFPTHDTLGKSAYSWHKQSEFTFLGGTNLLSGRFIGRNTAQWKAGFRDTGEFNDVIGIALGWQSYNDNIGKLRVPRQLLQKYFYSKIFSNSFLHSVRDSYTQKKLLKLGINSINTSCVTMWNLTEDHLSKIKRQKSDTVVLTITDYHLSQDRLDSYRKMIEIALTNYSFVYLWLQSPNDYSLLSNIDIEGFEKIRILPPDLRRYDSILEKGVDYIGTRLHAGIRSLQKGNRTLIIEVDNRATEIAKDTNLPTLNYKNIDQLDDWINHDQIMDIHIPFDRIAEWKAQFE
ncbi:polysaccharide pyruvyl transferase family protein [Oenococcus oeni]|uniref:Polysaccharide pyruvyl transferase family protein n=1 Tax=Oenococcus oeni TaxID=1247 RepID=A0AAJ2P1K6_OENOE|nr:polysaccharide pyruvyl transferase family protein [Oenococcus oeni]MDV7714404.1 polysaccharide pyruvyl transferase family protein [Oenococcus oeni]